MNDSHLGVVKHEHSRAIKVTSELAHGTILKFSNALVSLGSRVDARRGNRKPTALALATLDRYRLVA
jgi:hypothetical protein